MLKVVIFDFGGVLVRTVSGEPRSRWEQELHLAPGQAADIVFGVETDYDCQLGQVSDAEHWQWVGRRLGLNEARLACFRREFFAADELDANLMAYIERLRAHYHVGLLSNAADSLRRVLSEVLAITPCFDSITISAEEGVMKPDARIFELALGRAGACPQEALFVDDNLANVEAAARLGMRTIHIRDAGTTYAGLVAATGVA